jgi:hypothetical protein
MLGEEYELQSSSLCSFLRSPVTSFLFGPNILLRTLFSNTLSLYFYLNVRDQVSHPYRTTVKFIVLLAVPGHALLWLSVVKWKERKEKEYLS